MAVRPKVIEMLQFVVDGNYPGVQLTDETLIPNALEMQKFPNLSLHHGKSKRRQKEDGWYIINLKRVAP